MSPSPITNAMQALLGPVPFKVTQNPPGMEPTAKPVTVLAVIPATHGDAYNTDGTADTPNKNR